MDADADVYFTTNADAEADVLFITTADADADADVPRMQIQWNLGIRVTWYTSNLEYEHFNS